MKGLFRIGIMGALIVAHQLLAPLSGPAQTPDPCPAPSPSPSPSPTQAPRAGSIPSSPSPEPSPSPSPSPTPDPCPSPSPPTEHPTPDPGPLPSPDPQPNPGPAPAPEPSPTKDPAGPPPGPSPAPSDPVTSPTVPIPAPPPIYVPGGLAPIAGGSPLKPPIETGDGVVLGPGETGPVAAPPIDQTDPPFAISGPNSTAGLLRILSEVTGYRMPLKKALLEVVAPFPVAGPAWWIDDWHAPRSGGRLHQGLDIFAPRGTPLVAAADGVVTQKYVGALPGISVEITGERGVQYFYAHLEDWAKGLELGQEVKMGQVIGYVGNTGNAISTPPHLHFEYQPLGIPEPPKPRVDRWIKLAEGRALALLERLSGSPAATAGFRLTRLFDLGGEGGQNAAGQLLLFASSQPGLSSLEMANTTLGQMAWEIDWGEQADKQLTQLVEDYRQYVAEQAFIGLSPWPFEEEPVATTTETGTDGSD